jgi:hypothetical protein
VWNRTHLGILPTASLEEAPEAPRPREDLKKPLYLRVSVAEKSFASLEARRVFVPPDAGAVVTDDRHPAERDWAEVSRAWREKTRRLLGAM